MVLVDTSVWIDHFRDGNSQMINLLNEGIVVTHPLIIGELACGNLKNRSEILPLLQELPISDIAEHEDVLQFIENHQLMGKGLGFIDMHLLASVIITNIPLWTLDKKLYKIATKLNSNYKYSKITC